MESRPVAPAACPWDWVVAHAALSQSAPRPGRLASSAVATSQKQVQPSVPLGGPPVLAVATCCSRPEKADPSFGLVSTATTQRSTRARSMACVVPSDPVLTRAARRSPPGRREASVHQSDPLVGRPVSSKAAHRSTLARARERLHPVRSGASPVRWVATTHLPLGRPEKSVLPLGPFVGRLESSKAPQRSMLASQTERPLPVRSWSNPLVASRSQPRQSVRPSAPGFGRRVSVAQRSTEDRVLQSAPCEVSLAMPRRWKRARSNHRVLPLAPSAASPGSAARKGAEVDQPGCVAGHRTGGVKPRHQHLDPHGASLGAGPRQGPRSSPVTVALGWSLEQV
jgi:hypothetical protein